MSDHELCHGPQETERLRASIETFARCIAALPASSFLRAVTAWSPRDVVAHLIGWNVQTLEGCRDLLQGKAPIYLSDAADDFQHVNAVSVRRYNSTDRDVLLNQLRSTADALLRYLEALAPRDWDRDCGVWEADGQPASIRGEIEALTADYLGHAHEVATWAQSGETTR
ncbi:MAG TPA: maleylpyruvate isomerase N-terminal domain-containing protein [Ktedonobacterales bacterium]|nr:maleylpyruvate isomerase N-terminal domain-containing protein [Ktedonobacterales bacterium]